MDSVLRALLVYIVLFIILRLSGKRTLNTNTPFGLVLIFLISSSVADVLKDEDKSITNGVVLATSLVLIHLAFARLKWNKRSMEKVIEDVPTLLVKNGELLKDRMERSRITTEDILYAGRKQKLKQLHQIKYAILETDGSLCIIPKEE
ncbi:MAG: DUF421 domain-containing protein [Bacteroidia bacterium]